MSTDHRKPLVAFVLLAVAAVVLVVQRADAEADRWLEAAGGAMARVHGAVLPDTAGSTATGPTPGGGPALGAVDGRVPSRRAPGTPGPSGVLADPGNRPDAAVSRDEERRALRGRHPGEARRPDHAGTNAHNAGEGRGAERPGHTHAHWAHTRGREADGRRAHKAEPRRGDEQSQRHEG